MPASSAAATGKTEVGDRGSAGEGNGSKTDVVGGGGGSSLLEELMGGLSLPGFAAAPAEASQPAGGERESVREARTLRAVQFEIDSFAGKIRRPLFLRGVPV